jgi:hypothetical protein
LKLADAGGDLLSPRSAEAGPVRSGRCPAGWERVQRGGDLVQAQTDALGRAYERESAKDVPGVAPLVAGGAIGGEQTALS